MVRSGILVAYNKKREVDYPLSKLLDMVGSAEQAHRSIPFWSLNDKLEPEMLREQIRAMHSAGIGGFFMHARGGLETEYMGEDWLNCIGACIDEADKLGMEAWAYDENGWPSGFADDVVTAQGWEYWQKWLSVTECGQEMPQVEHALGYYRVTDGVCERLQAFEPGAYCVYIGYNRYYIDILSHKVISYFLEVTHERYFAHSGSEAGKAWVGFFTDEPQYSGRGAPWTNDMETIFKDKYGYDLLDCLPALMLSLPGCERVRNDYWSLVAELFVDAFGRQIYDWCHAHNLKTTGHMMAENSLASQLGTTSGCMQFYPYFDMPGMDHLGRQIDSPIQPKQVGSVAEQLGRPALTETFALCGWDVSLEELKWIAEWQYVNGINVTCQHLAPYTLRGLRKRDYPPALSIQQSWFSEYKYFNDYFARLGALLQSGRAAVDVLMLHPIRSAYVVADRSREALNRLDEAFRRETNLLSDLHIDFHYGDEKVMETYASAADGVLTVGRCAYKAVVLPTCYNITENTYRLLRAFADGGGALYTLGDRPALIDGVADQRLTELLQSAVALSCEGCVTRELSRYAHFSVLEDGKPCAAVHYNERVLEDGERVAFLVNHDNEKAHSCVVDFGVNVSVRKIDLAEMTETAVLPSCDGTYTVQFAPMQSYVFAIRDGKTAAGCGCAGGKAEIIGLADTFTVQRRDLNALTLDFCDYRIDGGEWVENVAIIVLASADHPTNASIFLRLAKFGCFPANRRTSQAPATASSEFPQLKSKAVSQLRPWVRSNAMFPANAAATNQGQVRTSRHSSAATYSPPGSQTLTNGFGLNDRKSPICARTK